MDKQSISRRLRVLKNLVVEYFSLAHGELIPHHTEKLRIFDIRGSKYHKHPHKAMRVYISRKALKHFVERRSRELTVRHTPVEVIESLYFAIDHIQESITNFDLYEFEPPKHFYSKDYSHLGKSMLRILVHDVSGKLEIVSIHYKERKRNKNATG